MGLSFILFLMFVILPSIIIIPLFILFQLNKSSSGKKTNILKKTTKLFIGIVLFYCFLIFNVYLFSKKEVSREDIYGEYIIDRSKYSGRQSDWQYNSFKFELRNNHKLYFYEMDNGKVTKVSIIPVYFCIPNHLALVKDSTRHHILSDNPTLYRETFNFYYVFKSPKFGNVFFKRGSWKKLD